MLVAACLEIQAYTHTKSHYALINNKMNISLDKSYKTYNNKDFLPSSIEQSSIKRKRRQLLRLNSVGDRCSDTDKGKPKYTKKNLSQCYCLPQIPYGIGSKENMRASVECSNRNMATAK